MTHEVQLLVLGEIVFVIVVVLAYQARRYLGGVSRLKRRSGTRGAVSIAPSRAALLARPADSPAFAAAVAARNAALSAARDPSVELRPAESVMQPGIDEFGRRKLAPWEAFAGDKQLLESYRVTPAELESLRHTSMLGSVQSKDDILMILKTIRGVAARRH